MPWNQKLSESGHNVKWKVLGLETIILYIAEGVYRAAVKHLCKLWMEEVDAGIRCGSCPQTFNMFANRKEIQAGQR